MDYYGLTRPKTYRSIDICKSVLEEYIIFCNEFISCEESRKLEGEFIYIKNQLIYGMHERYLHSISMKNKEYYNMFPCNNDESYVNCNKECDISKAMECIKEINRVDCLYRLARVHWIPQIIKLANSGNENTKIWRKEFKDRSGKWYWKRFLRYEKGLIDYIIVFNERYRDKKLNFLDFRTGYPIFTKKDKKDFERDYLQYIKSKKIKYRLSYQ